MSSNYVLDVFDELIMDGFAGGGGASTGIEMGLGRGPNHATNHDKFALGMHRINHATTVHHEEDIFFSDPALMDARRRWAMAWFSPDCKHFSKAKGGKPLSKKIRGLASVQWRWAKVRTPVLFMENVEEMKTWGPLHYNPEHPEDCMCGAPCGKPIEEHKGRTFQCFIDALKGGIVRNHPDVPELLKKLNAPIFSEQAARMIEPLTQVTEDDLVRGFGYDVELRELRACDFGSPTIRKRLYMIARCDGLPILWPKPTHFAPAKLTDARKAWRAAGSHGIGPRPWRTVAECIDWTLPVHSIFLTKTEAKRLKINCKRTLAGSSLRRIAKGVHRYVMMADHPFLISLTHQGDDDRVESIMDPAMTVTGAQRGEKALVNTENVAPFVSDQSRPQVQHNHAVDEPGHTQCAEVKGGHFTVVGAHVLSKHPKDEPKPATEPMGAASTRDSFSVVTGTLVGAGGPARAGEPRPVTKPMDTILLKSDKHLATAHLCREFGESVGQDIQKPAPTVMPDGQGKTALISGTVVHMAHGEVDKSGKKRGRSAHDLTESSPAVLGTPDMALAAVNLMVNTTGHSGGDAAAPAPTVPTGGHHAVIQSQVVSGHMLQKGHLKSNSDMVKGLDEPMRSQVSRAEHNVVATTLVQTGYGEAPGQAPRALDIQKPSGTIVGTGKQAVVAANVVKMRGDAETHAPGHAAGEPIHTISADGTHHGIAVSEVMAPPVPSEQPELGAPFMLQNNDGFNRTPHHPVTRPVSTLTSSGSNQSLVSSKLIGANHIKYYGNEEEGHPVSGPSGTVTTKERFAHIESEIIIPPMREEHIAMAHRVAAFLRAQGIEFEGEFATTKSGLVIVDIGMRMLAPRELYRCQGFPDDYVIDRAYVFNPQTRGIDEIKLNKTQQIRMCGNSVCPQVAAAIVAANCPHLIVHPNLRTRQYELAA